MGSSGTAAAIQDTTEPHDRVSLTVLSAPRWDDYELIDSGDGKKLERFGRYHLVRPEVQALWSPGLPPREWHNADARFERGPGEDGPGQWVQRHPLPEQWNMRFDKLVFLARLTPFRHTGIFPEHSAHWDWIHQRLQGYPQQPRVLVLFGYTGLTTLVAAQAGAHVCHVDASRPAIRWARENQAASGLEAKPVRWIVDDVMKFLAREERRSSRYDMIIMDPPVFGRGPKGQVWRLHESLPALVEACVRLLSDQPAGILINAYATTFSSITLHHILAGALGTKATQPFGRVGSGELVLIERVASRPLSLALYAQWPKGRV